MIHTIIQYYTNLYTHSRVLGPLQTTTQVLSIGSTLCSNPKYAATLQNMSGTMRGLQYIPQGDNYLHVNFLQF